jgi:mannose-6-phosphate isomerase-like protein (cupin superfamily)
MTKRSRRIACTSGVAAACLIVSACAWAPGSPKQAAVLDSVALDARTTTALSEVAARIELAADEPARVVDLARDGDTSQHLVGLRDREPLHRHDRHAIAVVLLRGRGRMHVAGEERAVGEGSILYVPRGTVHAFINESDEPAVAWVVYAPPYDGKDRVLIEPVAP